jgi:HopA1 effector protein family
MSLPPIFQELASKIQISSSSFSVSHPKCQEQKIAVDTLVQLKKLPQSVQDEYLISLIQKYIFGIYFSGILFKKEVQALHLNYEFELKDTPSEVDWRFYEKLHHNNHGKGSWNPYFRVIKHEADGSIAVEKKSITTYINREQDLRLEEQSARIGDVVSVPRPSSHIRNHFYIAYGDLVYTWQHPSVFIYFNFSPKGAIALMGYLTEQLNVAKIPFDFNVLYNPSSYGQYNSGILRINKNSYEVTRQILQTVYVENKLHFQAHIPIFTKVLAPGLSLAERPKNEFRFLEGFGLNRCKIVAKALLEAHQKDDESPEARIQYITQHFERLEIDLEHPYLNPGSEDIYTPLNIA